MLNFANFNSRWMPDLKIKKRKENLNYAHRYYPLRLKELTFSRGKAQEHGKTEKK